MKKSERDEQLMTMLLSMTDDELDDLDRTLRLHQDRKKRKHEQVVYGVGAMEADNSVSVGMIFGPTTLKECLDFLPDYYDNHKTYVFKIFRFKGDESKPLFYWDGEKWVKHTNYGF